MREVGLDALGLLAGGAWEAARKFNPRGDSRICRELLNRTNTRTPRSGWFGTESIRGHRAIRGQDRAARIRRRGGQARGQWVRPFAEQVARRVIVIPLAAQKCSKSAIVTGFDVMLSPLYRVCTRVAHLLPRGGRPRFFHPNRGSRRRSAPWPTRSSSRSRLSGLRAPVLHGARTDYCGRSCRSGTCFMKPVMSPPCYVKARADGRRWMRLKSGLTPIGRRSSFFHDGSEQRRQARPRPAPRSRLARRGSPILPAHLHVHVRFSTRPGRSAAAGGDRIGDVIVIMTTTFGRCPRMDAKDANFFQSVGN